MLHFETIEPATLELLRSILSISELNSTRLVGGTANILEIYSLPQVLAFYQEKYPNASPFMALKSLLYFDDAEKDIMPIMIKEQSWHEIKEIITQSVNALK